MITANVASGISDVTSRIADIESRIAALTAQFTSNSFDLEALAGGGPGGVGGIATAGTGGAGTWQLAGGPTGDPGSVDGAWVDRLPAAGRPWAPAIDRAARDAGVDPALLASLVQHESGFRPDAVSHAGAIGLAQLMPGTAEGLGVDPRNPEENLAGGARYLRTQLDRFGHADLALAAYNAGPNRVAQAGGIPRIEETQRYVERVLGTYQELR